MKRGDLFRVYRGARSDPKDFRVFAVVSRGPLIDSRHSTVICAPVYSAQHGISTQVLLDSDDGMKSPCSIHCDELMSLPKTILTDFVSSLSSTKISLLNRALAVAVGLT